MPVERFVPPEILERYAVSDWRNGLAVLKHANEAEWADILSMLQAFELRRSEIATPGGAKSKIANRFDDHLRERGWRAKRFKTSITVDDVEHPSPTHEVDMFKGRVALEVEWNNKDPFYDRDLNNFRLLFDLRVIDVGVIVTRASELQAIFDQLGRGASYGNSTTHMGKLTPRLEGGGGGGCPVVAFAIRRTTYVDDGDDQPGGGRTENAAAADPARSPGRLATQALAQDGTDAV